VAGSAPRAADYPESFPGPRRDPRLLGMRLLHTSDWHLGLDLAGHGRLEEQARVLDWLRGQCRELGVDALLVAGDVFDVANPSSAAQRLLADFLVDLCRDCPRVTAILTGGNHDSALRLEIARPYGQALGRIHLVGGLDERAPDVEDKAVVVIRDGGGAALGACLAVPCMRVGDLDCRPAEGEPLAQAYERSLAAFHGRLLRRARELAPGKPVVGMGHLTLSRGEKSGSEQLLVGGIDGIGADAIAAGLDYLALGHLHRGQQVGSPRIRYSGSPFSIGFDERRYAHHVLLVELGDPGTDGAAGALTVTEIAVPQAVALLRLPEVAGTWDELERAVAAVPWADHAARPSALQPLVELQVVDDGTVGDLPARVEALCRDKPLRLVRSLRLLRSGEGPAAGEASAEGVLALTLGAETAPLQLFSTAWVRKYGAPPPPELTAAFAEVVAQVRTGGGRA